MNVETAFMDIHGENYTKGFSLRKPTANDIISENDLWSLEENTTYTCIPKIEIQSNEKIRFSFQVILAQLKYKFYGST